MDVDEPGEITRLLQSWREGTPEAFNELIPVAYSQLHRIALGLMRGERNQNTLQPTALVNELYLRLLHQRQVTWKDRKHFFTFAARLMRNILIDHARARHAQRRGGPEQIRLEISPDLSWIGSSDEQLLDLDLALNRLEEIDERKAHLVELRFFLSCTAEEAGKILGISHATVERELKFARGWLYRELRHGPAQPQPELHGAES